MQYVLLPFILNFLIMEALVYTFLLIGTLMVLFFAAFFRETPKIIKS
jgi:photosystem II PsbT protein